MSKRLVFTPFIRKGTTYEKRPAVIYENDTPGEKGRKDAMVARIVKDAIDNGHDLVIRAGEHDTPFPELGEDAAEAEGAVAETETPPAPDATAFNRGDAVQFPEAVAVRRDNQTIKIAAKTTGTVLKHDESGVLVETEKYGKLLGKPETMTLYSVPKEPAAGDSVTFVKDWTDGKITIPAGTAGMVKADRDAEGFLNVTTEQFGDVLCSDEVEAV